MTYTESSAQGLAAFLGAHAFVTLLAATAVLLLLMSGFWLLLQRYGDYLWRSAARGLDALLRSRLGRRTRRFPVVPGAVGRALAFARFVGLEALAALTVSVGAFAVFVALADEIGFDEELGRFDTALSDALRIHVDPWVLRLFALVTRLGDVGFLVVIGALVAITLAWLGRGRLATIWIVATSLGGVLNWLLKTLFERARPMHEHGLLHAEGWSFPSGHASGAMLVYGLLGYLIVRHGPREWRLPAILAAALLIVVVGFSRVILQVHYLSDVLAGYVSAAAWVAVWIAGIEASRRRRHLSSNRGRLRGAVTERRAS